MKSQVTREQLIIRKAATKSKTSSNQGVLTLCLSPTFAISTYRSIHKGVVEQQVRTSVSHGQSRQTILLKGDGHMIGCLKGRPERETSLEGAETAPDQRLRPHTW